MCGKGDKRRPESEPGLFVKGYDRILWVNKEDDQLVFDVDYEGDRVGAIKCRAPKEPRCSY